MNDEILITELNDFIFCPVSIYFHKLYGGVDKMVYQDVDQIDGTAAHEAVDHGRYSTLKDVLQGIDVYSEEFNVRGKIDTFNNKSGVLRERKKKIKQIFDGYVFQLYAQYFALVEMGYEVKRIELYSIDDNKVYPIDLPENDREMYSKFKMTIKSMREFNLSSFKQENTLKCQRCIYEPSCDRAMTE